MTRAQLQGVVIDTVVRIKAAAPSLSSDLIGEGLKRRCVAFVPAQPLSHSGNLKMLLVPHAV